MITDLLAQVTLVIHNTQNNGCHRTTETFIQDNWPEVSNLFALVSLTFYVSFPTTLSWVCSPESSFLPMARRNPPGRRLTCSAVTSTKSSLLGAAFTLLTWPASFALHGPTALCSAWIPLARAGLEDVFSPNPVVVARKSQHAFCMQEQENFVIVWNEKGDLGKIAFKAFTLHLLL